jgi:DNA polymerase-1
MLLATWNLNSIRTRQARLLAWLDRYQPDIVCLQELKLPDRDFPFDAIRAAGYHAAVHGQPSYNGVAILSRDEPTDVRIGLDDGVDDPQARLISARFGDVRVISAYFPNGQHLGSDKYVYKIEWMRRLRAYLDKHHDPSEPLALCGDFNVAPDDLDAARPADWADSVLCHADARAALEHIRAWGLVDLFRQQHPGGGIYSWWDYRNRAFDRDDGLRIDHIFVTPALAGRGTASGVDRAEREGEKPSDHAPVAAVFDAPPPEWLGGAAGERVAQALGDRGTVAGAESAVGPGSEQSAAGAESTKAARSSAGKRAAFAGSPKRKKLILIDGHSLAYRAFYGLPLYDRRGKISFNNSRGEFTNAVYGFANMLIKAWTDEKPDYIAVAFDAGRTFRDDLYEPYKGTRQKMPDELVPQIDRIIQLVEAFDIPAVTAEGFEADDILGTLATRAAADGLDALIVTGDSDAFQLVGPQIRVMAPGRLWSDVAVWDEDAVRGRYSLDPIQLIDFKALKGDTSDNVPGVRGIGEKTALALLLAYGTVEGIYEHLGEVTPDRARNALEAGRDMAALSKDLITIRTDILLDIAWESCAVHSYDRGKVEALFDVLEFRSIRNRLPAGGVVAASAGSEAGGEAATDTGESGTARVPGNAEGSGGSSGGAASGSHTGGASDGRAAVPGSAGKAGLQMALFAADPGSGGGDRPAKAPVTQAVVVDTAEALDSLLAALRAAEVIAFDVETTSTDPLQAVLVGIALAVQPGSGYYVPVGHVTTEPQLPLATVIQALAPILEDPARPKVAHNAKYDMAVLRLAGIELRGLAFDTMLAEFLIDPSGRLGLKALARSRLGVEMTEIGALIGTGKNQITMERVPIADAAPYAAADADITLRLMQLQVPELDELGLRGLLDSVDLPLVPVLIDMELAGVLLDTDLLGGMSARLAARLAEIEAEIYKLVGRPFNINSPAQLGEVLFGELKLRAPGGRKTATGKVSVAADVLESMRGDHAVIDLVLEHRQLSKIKGTYLDALPRLINPRTGRVHTSFNQTGAVSGRLASQDPNLQNIPIRTELGREVRQAFIVPKGWRLIAADYSQVELRIAAHLTRDPGLIEAFTAGEDIHRATAARVFGIPPEAVTADQRSFAKRVVFGLLYGMGTQSLAQQTGTTMKEAQAFVDAYFAAFPNIKGYLDDTKRRAREIGYVETLLGRRRYFPVLASETRDSRTRVMQAAAEREAINHPMQGSAADIIKFAMIRIHAALAAGGYRARLLLQVHDELILEAPKTEVEAVEGLVKVEMEAAYSLDPPLKVEIGAGRNWDEVK